MRCVLGDEEDAVFYGLLSKRKLWLLVVLFPLLIAACGGMSVDIRTYGHIGDNAPRPDLLVPESGPVLNNFPEVWNRCGKSDGLGEWIAGPVWYRNRYLAMVYRNAVLAWDVRRPEKGVFLLALNGNKVRHTRKSVRMQNMITVGGVEVPQRFAKWIADHGGFACSGKPVGDLTEQGDLLCQKFANITLCYSKNGGLVYPLPLGKHFFEIHPRLFSTELKIDYSPDWFVQPNIEAESESLLKIVVSPLFRTLPSTPSVVLAVQVRELQVHKNAVQVRKNAVQVRENNDDYTFYYRLVRLRGNFFSDIVKVPTLEKGSTRFEVEVCVYYAGKWVACGNNSTQVWKP